MVFRRIAGIALCVPFLLSACIAPGEPGGGATSAAIEYQITVEGGEIHVAEDTSVVVTVKAYSKPATQGAIKIVVGQEPSHGTLVEKEGSFTYTPKPNFSGTDPITVRGELANGTKSELVAITFIVDPENDMPVSSNGGVTVSEDTLLNATLTASDPDGDVLTFIKVLDPLHGSLTLNANGAYSYLPAANYQGSDSFTYKVNDGTVDGPQLTVNIFVTPVNDAPLAFPLSVTGPEDQAVTGVLTGSDAESSPLSFYLVGVPADGIVSLNADTGAFTFTPDANFTGATTFSFRVSDGTLTSANQSVNVNINATNDDPTVYGANVTGAEDTQIGGGVSGADPEGSILSYGIQTDPLYGAVSINGLSGAFTYTPNANFNGTDSFAVYAADGNGGIGTHVIIVTVTPVADAPVADGMSFSMAEDDWYDDILTAGSPDGLAIASYEITANPANGYLYFETGTGFFEYYPDLDFNGIDAFTYIVYDENGLPSAEATVAITVTPVNDAPYIDTYFVQTNEDTPTLVVVDAWDAEGDPITLGFFEGPFSGMITGATGLEFWYTGDPDFTGWDYVGISASDGSLESQGYIDIEVRNINDAPTVEGAAYTRANNEWVVDTLSASDADNQQLFYSIITAPSSGDIFAMNAATGAFVYRPDPAFVGVASFGFRVSDGTLFSASASIVVTISASANASPVITAYDNNLITPEDFAVEGTATVSDAESDPVSLFLAIAPSLGTLQLAGTSYTYTPLPNAFGADEFQLAAFDGSAYSNLITVSVTISPVNDPPMPIAPTLVATTNTAGTVQIVHQDPDGDVLTYSVLSEPVTGNATVSLSGLVTYTPDNGFTGSDSMVVEVTDAGGLKGSVTVRILVGDFVTYSGVPGALPPELCGAGDFFSITSISPDPRFPLTLTAGTGQTFTATIAYSVLDLTSVFLGVDVVETNGNWNFYDGASMDLAPGCGEVTLTYADLDLTNVVGVRVSPISMVYSDTAVFYSVATQPYVRIVAVYPPAGTLLTPGPDGAYAVTFATEWDLQGEAFEAVAFGYNNNFDDIQYPALTTLSGTTVVTQAFQSTCFDNVWVSGFDVYNSATFVELVATVSWYVAPPVMFVEEINPMMITLGSGMQSSYMVVENCSEEDRWVSLMPDLAWVYPSDVSYFVAANSYGFLEYAVDISGVTIGAYQGILSIHDAITDVKITAGAAPITVVDTTGYSISPVTFSWISATGALVHGPFTDDEIATVALPFGIDYFGVPQTEVSISSNGFVTFGASTYDTYWSEPVPTTELPMSLMVNWEDMYVAGNGGIRAATTGITPNRKFIITWSNVESCCDTSTPSTYQLVLSEGSHDFLVQYGALNATGVAGANLGDGITGITWNVQSNTAYLIQAD